VTSAGRRCLRGVGRIGARIPRIGFDRTIPCAADHDRHECRTAYRPHVDESREALACRGYDVREPLDATAGLAPAVASPVLALR
jgi:hypothetical protein